MDEKPQDLIAHAFWEEKRAEGFRVLQTLSSPLQHRALGPAEYAFIFAALKPAELPKPTTPINSHPDPLPSTPKSLPPPKIEKLIASPKLSPLPKATKAIGPKSRVPPARVPLASKENKEVRTADVSLDGSATKKRPLPRPRMKESNINLDEPIMKKRKTKPPSDATVIDLTLSP